MRTMRFLIWAGLVPLLASVALRAQQAIVPASSGAVPNLAGSGMTNFIPIWKNSTTLSNSTIFETAGKVGIGTKTPAATLEVNGTSKFDQTVTFPSGQTFPGTAMLGSNTFTATQTIGAGDLSISSGNLDLPQTTASSVGVVTVGGSGFIHACCSANAENTFVGANAGNFVMTGGLNTAIGNAALFTNTGGNNNTATGVFALLRNTTGSGNTASGLSALQDNTTGGSNTAVGGDALFFNSTGAINSATGVGALFSNTAGVNNTASGGSALYSNDAGSNNVALGNCALVNTTRSKTSLPCSATTPGQADANTAIGMLAGKTNTTGDSNTFVGFQADAASGTLTNATAIGANAVVFASNALVIGSTAAENGSANTKVGIDVGTPSNIFTVLQGGGHAISDGWDVYSSRRWKSEIRPLNRALDKVERLRGVEYTYTANGRHDIGMIAEEVGQVVPEVVSYEDNGKDARGIDYARLTALLVEAVKQQQPEIRQEQTQIRRLQSEIRALQSKDRTSDGAKCGTGTTGRSSERARAQ